MFRKVSKLFLPFLLAVSAFAYTPFSGYCEVGGTVVSFTGTQFTPLVQGSFPGCTVEVLNPDGSDAVIYSDNNGTPKSNPFTADSQSGYWSFFSAATILNARLSNAGIVTPFVVQALGTGDLSDFVTLDTDQSISGSKTFTSVNGVVAPLFNASGTGTSITFKNNDGSFSVNGNGNESNVSLGSNGLYVNETAADSSGTGGYIHLALLDYPNGTNPFACKDIYGNGVSQPSVLSGLPVFGENDAIMWVGPSPLPGADPPGCLPTPFPAQQQVNGLNINTYVFSLVGFATARPAYNSFDSLVGGMSAISFTSFGYMDTGTYSGPLAGGPPDPWFNPVSGPGWNHLGGALAYSQTAHCEAVYDGTTWACISNAGGNPGGTDSDVQFNAGGAFGGSSNFQWGSSTYGANTLFIGPVDSLGSGVFATTFQSTAIGGHVAFLTTGGYAITGAGDATFKSIGGGVPVSSIQPFAVDQFGNVTLTNLTVNGSCTGCNAPLFCVGGGSVNTVTCPGVPSGLGAYYTGIYNFLASEGTNTGAATLNINSLGAKSILNGGTALSGGEIVSGNTYILFYDGTQFNLGTTGGGVTAINTTLTGNVTNVALTNTPNTFTVFQTFTSITAGAGSFFVSGVGKTAIAVNTSASGSGALSVTQSGTDDALDVSGNSIFTGNGTFQHGASGEIFNLMANSGTSRAILFSSQNGSPGVLRWQVRANTAPESGSNTGSNFEVEGCNDSGTCLVYLGIDRASAAWSINSSQVIQDGGAIGGFSYVSGNTGTNRVFGFLSTDGTPGVLRWKLRTNNATESGSDAGSNFEIDNCNDSGTCLTAMTINRATGNVTLNQNLSILGTCTGCGAGNPAGANTQVQFNNSGVFGASSNLTWNGSVLDVLGTVAAGNGIVSNGVGSFTQGSAFATITSVNSGSGYAAQFQNSNTSGSVLDLNASATGVSGYLIIGITAAAHMLTMVDSGGTCTLTGASGMSCTSDERLKQGIKPIGSTLTGIMKLRPIEYEMRNGVESVGLSAQNVQTFFPRAVHEAEDGYLQLSYSELVPYLIRAVQEQQREIESLKRKR